MMSGREARSGRGRSRRGGRRRWPGPGWAAAAALAAAWLPATGIAGEADLCAPVVESYRQVPCEEFNELAQEALARGEGWPGDPLACALLVVERLAGAGCHDTCVRMEKEPGEGCRSARVVVVRDGFLDDSVRGDWTEIHLEKGESGSWRALEIRRAERCRRGSNRQSYAAEPCP